jgi:hypothetical protein
MRLIIILTCIIAIIAAMHAPTPWLVKAAAVLILSSAIFSNLAES